MRIIGRLAFAVVLAGTPAWLSSLSASPLEPGRWALSASGQPMLVLELHKDAHAKGGWAGALAAPEHFNVDPTFTTFSNVEGPAKIEPIVATSPKGDSLSLIIRDNDSGLSHFVWTPSQQGGTLEFKEVGAKAVLVPAKADEQVSSVWDRSKSYSVQPDWPDNPEMSAMFDADQSDRQNMDKIDWDAIATHDEEHRARTKALLAAGMLHSASDYYHAAFIFQHGHNSNDYLLAHTLAVVAASLGRKDAAWIAAASLDRYLMSIGQKQIYGTQFMTPAGKPVTQEPYDRSLVSDPLRKALGVPTIANQEKQRLNVQKDMDELNKAHAAAATVPKH